MQETELKQGVTVDEPQQERRPYVLPKVEAHDEEELLEGVVAFTASCPSNPLM